MDDASYAVVVVAEKDVVRVVEYDAADCLNDDLACFATDGDDVMLVG